MVDKFTIEEQPDAAKEVLRLLEYNDIAYTEEGGTYYMTFSDGMHKWETRIHVEGQRVLICSAYPYLISTLPNASAVPEAASALPENEAQAAAAVLMDRINEINAELAEGALFIHGDRIIVRTGADLFDAFSAYEQLARALEYNAEVLAGYWSELLIMSICRK
ncbi:MAG: hypothetical protein Q4E57_09760 [Eubacteriales bacterium]|nr:hypothetical protein [Eubacteriales bacterium]